MTYFKSGSWNCLCDRCGVKYKSEELRREWTGLMVCLSCFETRHPSDLIRVPKDDPSIPWARPVPAATYVAAREFILTEDRVPIEPQDRILPLQTEN